jgi:predicted nuclease of restriction endonuclease-like (RecB) superfamily
MLREEAVSQSGAALTADEEIKDPLVLEFLGLKDEYSESDLEDAQVHHLENFVHELGNDFAFIAR